MLQEQLIAKAEGPDAVNGMMSFRLLPRGSCRSHSCQTSTKRLRDSPSRRRCRLTFVAPGGQLRGKQR